MYNSCPYICRAVHEANAVIQAAGQEAFAHLELGRYAEDTSGVLYGRLFNWLGQPVKDGVVKIVSETYEPVAIGKTDHLGGYCMFAVPPNQPLRVIGTAENCDISAQVEICIKERQAQKVDLFLTCSGQEDTGVLTGLVLNKLNALPLEKAQVLLFQEIGGVPHFKDKTQTNEFGQFALTRLAPGGYLVQISMPGYLGEQYRVTLCMQGQMANRVTSLCPDCHSQLKGTVSGVITDHQKEPIADADVILYRIDPNNAITPIAHTKTNSNGVYLFINVEIGAYKVVAK